MTAGPDDVDALLEALPPASLVVNATGMGKDRPGSPVSAGARFPERGVVWEFNYRGPLDFWHQALAQQQERSCTSRTAGATSCTAGARRSRRSSTSRCRRETVDELGRIATRLR